MDLKFLLVEFHGINFQKIKFCELKSNDNQINFFYSCNFQLFAWESREFLRTRLIHRWVRVKYDPDASQTRKSKKRAIYGIIKVRKEVAGANQNRRFCYNNKQTEPKNPQNLHRVNSAHSYF